MTTKEKTRSSVYPKPEAATNKNKQTSQVFLSPNQNQKNEDSLEYNQLSHMRFLRKDLDKDDVFDPRVFITNELSYEDVVDLKQVFDTYDSTSMGVMLPNDLKLFLEQNGFNPSKTTVYDILAEFDQGETGGISFKDFMRAMGTKPSQGETKKEISSIFKKYDKEGKGYIDISDIRQVNKRLKENMDEEVIKSIIAKKEISKEGKIYFDDFYRVMTEAYSWT